MPVILNVVVIVLLLSNRSLFEVLLPVLVVSSPPTPHHRIDDVRKPRVRQPPLDHPLRSLSLAQAHSGGETRYDLVPLVLLYEQLRQDAWEGGDGIAIRHSVEVHSGTRANPYLPSNDPRGTTEAAEVRPQLPPSLGA